MKTVRLVTLPWDPPPQKNITLAACPLTLDLPTSCRYASCVRTALPPVGCLRRTVRVRCPVVADGRVAVGGGHQSAAVTNQRLAGRLAPALGEQKESKKDIPAANPDSPPL